MRRRRKSIAFLVSFLMLLSFMNVRTSVFAADNGITVQFNNGNTATSSNTINAKFKVTNTGGSSVNLASLKLRYYYTQDENKTQNFFCDHAGMSTGGSYTDVTRSVTGTFVKMNRTTENADTYLEVGFSSGAGTLPAGASVEIQTRIARNDWSNYNQSNDFSYKSAGSFTDWDQIAAFLDGTLVFGKEPFEEPEQKDPTISPTSATFDKYRPSDIRVTLTPNGNTFSGISDLSKGSDYTVSGNTVTIAKSYLSTLDLGTTKLTFDFGVSNNPELTIKVTDTTPVEDALTVKIASKTANAGSTVTVPITMENVEKVNNIGTCNFYIKYDSKLLEAVSVEAGDIVKNAAANLSTKSSSGEISFVFLDNTIGDELITEDGVFANITFKVIGESGETAEITFGEDGTFGDGNMGRITDVNYVQGGVTIQGETKEGLSVEAGMARGNTGDTVTVPITFKNVAKMNNIGTCNFNVAYDSDLLEAVSVEAGDIVKNAAANLSTKISEDSINFVFLDNTIGDELITEDGVFANITFKILGETGKTAPITFGSDSAFGDGSMSRIKDVSFADGSVVIKEAATEALLAAIKAVSGKKGDTVTVPVTLENVADAGNVGAADIYLNYDAELLEAVSVEAGSIISNKDSFSSSINDGSIGMGYLDRTLGKELITRDGVFANITFKILGDTGKKANIEFTSDTAFGDGKLGRIADVEYTNGSVVIKEVTTEGLLAAIEAVSGKKGDTVTVPVTLENVADAGNIGAADIYLNYDAELLEAVSVEAGSIISNKDNFSSSINDGSIGMGYLDRTLGKELITGDGVFANITFKILGDTGKKANIKFTSDTAFGDGRLGPVADVEYSNGSVTIQSGSSEDFGVSIGKTSGNTGDTVTVPITLENVAKAGDIGTGNFYVEYDPALLEAVSAEAGSIVTNPAANFSSKISSGSISIVYLDNTIGDELITKDGVLANITFKILGAAGKTAKITFAEGGAFGNGNMKKITEVNYNNGSVTIKKVVVEDALTVAAGSIAGSTGDTITVPVTLANVAKAGNVGTGNFYVEYDPALLEAISAEAGSIVTNPAANFSSKISNGSISIVYLDNTIGEELITQDGVLANITFKILGAAGKTAELSFKEGGAFGNGSMEKITDVNYTNGSVTIKKAVVEDALTIAAGSKTGSTGDTITVPVTLANVAKAGNVGTGNFSITYDPALLEAVSVEAGSIVTSPAANFSSKISSGSISIVYLDNTIGDELITQDGVLANITFKILGAAGKTAALSFKEGGAFGNGSMEKIADVNYTNGSITIKKAVVENALTVAVDSKTGKTGDTITVPVTLANVAKAGNIGTGNFSITYDPALLEAVSVEAGNIVQNAAANFSSKISTGSISMVYLDNTIGEELITGDGVFANITFKILGATGKTADLTFKSGGAFGDGNMAKIKDVQYTDGSVVIKKEVTENSLSLKIGSAQANSGDTVKIPVTIANVEKAGNVGTGNFYLTYDTTLLEAVSVEAGSIVTNPAANFSGKIGSGSIGIVFLDNTVGDEPITKDGELAVITFKVLEAFKENADIVFKSGGAFGNGSMEKIEDVQYTNGSILASSDKPSITASDNTFDLAKASDITVTLQPADKSFKGITSLKEGTDYTVAGNTVKLLKSYLSTLSVGSQSLVFDFGVAENPVLELKIVDSTTVTDNLLITIGNVTGKPGETVTVPITLKNVVKAGMVGTCNFHVSYDSNLLEAVSVAPGDIVNNPAANFSSKISADSIGVVFLDNTIGDQLITEDGILLNITFKIIGTEEATAKVAFKESMSFGNASMQKIEDPTYSDGSVVIKKGETAGTLAVSIGSAAGSTGETVSVPIKLQNVEKAGMVGTGNFYVTYDPALLEAVSVKAGDIVKNADVNFTSKISAGSISIVFLDNSMGEELITKDGVLADITFKVLGKTGDNAKVAFKSGGAFGNGNMGKIESVQYTEGSITVEKVITGEPAIEPTYTVYDKFTPQDIEVKLIPNGNTFKGITGLTKDKDYVVSGDIVAILQSYLSGLSKGTETLIFDFGVENNPTFDLIIKDSTPITDNLTIAAGTATGNTEEVVVIPVTLKNVEKAGFVGLVKCNVTFDPSLLEAVSVEAGDIVTNVDNFTSKISAGDISLKFIDSTVGEESIVTDGVLANITFKVLGSADKKVPVTIKSGGTFANGSLEKITDVQSVGGRVIIAAANIEGKQPVTDATTDPKTKQQPQQMENPQADRTADPVTEQKAEETIVPETEQPTDKSADPKAEKAPEQTSDSETEQSADQFAEPVTEQ